MYRSNEHIELNRKLIVHLLQTANWLDAKISQKLKPFGISHIQFNVLKVLEHHHPDPISVHALKEGIIFNHADVTRLLDKLCGRGLITRSTCPSNRRKVDVGITTAGLELLDEIGPVLMDELETYYTDKISAEEAAFISGKIKSIRME